MKSTKTALLTAMTVVFVVVGGMTVHAGEVVPAETMQQTALEDTNVYGNTMGNMINGGLFLEDADYYYLYHGYDNCVYKTDKKTGLSVQLGSTALFNLNMVDGKIYGYRENQTNGYIVELDPNSGREKIIRSGKIDNLIVVNREIYITNLADGSLVKFSLDSGKETMLASQGVGTYTIYKDRVYFSLCPDNETLYSISTSGGELVKLNNVTSYMPNVYRDRIYYLAKESGAYSIRSMAIDGSGETVIANMDALYMNLYGSKLFFVNNNAKNELYYIELDAPIPTPVRLDLSAAVEKAVKEYAIVPPKNYQLLEYLALNFGPSHMMFMTFETFDGQRYDDVYLYDFATGEIMPIAYFCWTQQ